MDVLLKVCVIAVVTVLCAALIRDKNPAGAFMAVLAGGLVAIWTLLPMLRALIAYLNELAGRAGLSTPLLAPMLKTLVIAIAARITAELCRDMGEKALAAKVELAGVIAGIICAVPLIQEVLRLIGSL